jgi:hypothetical protein
MSVPALRPRSVQTMAGNDESVGGQEHEQRGRRRKTIWLSGNH